MRAIAVAVVVAAALVAAGCGGKNEQPRAVGGATTGVSSVPQNGGVARYAYPSHLVHSFMSSCRQRGGTHSACTCVLNHLRMNTPARELRQLLPLGRSGAPSSARKKLRAAGRSCGIRL